MRFPLFIVAGTVLAVGLADAKPAGVSSLHDKASARAVDRIVTGKSVALAHRQKWAARRADFVKCGGCYSMQAFPEEPVKAAQLPTNKPQ